MTTRLSVTATPGPERSFEPKIPGGGRSGERITDLTVWGIPGQLREFIAKDPAEPVPEAMVGFGSGYKSLRRDKIEEPPQDDLKARILRDDDEVLAIIMAALEVID